MSPCLHHTNDHVNPQVNPKASNLFAFYHNNSNDSISSGFISKLFLEKCLWFRSLSYWPDPPGWIVWLSWSGNTQISLAVTYVQCLMSRNVNKIFFADLEILDLTNLTHCLSIIQQETFKLVQETGAGWEVIFKITCWVTSHFQSTLEDTRRGPSTKLPVILVSSGL